MNATTKILFAAHSSAHRANGGLRSLYELILKLPAPPYTLLTSKSTPPQDYWRNDTITTLPVLQPAWQKQLSVTHLNRFLKATYCIGHLLRQSRPDIVVCNDINSMLSVAPAARIAGIPVVFYVRDVFEPHRPYGIKWKMASQLADCIICLSDEMKDSLQRRLRPILGRRTRTERIYSIVDRNTYHPISSVEKSHLRKSLGINEDTHAITYVGSVCDKKNQIELINALPTFLTSMPASHVYFVGDFRPTSDPYCRACKELAHKLNIAERISFVGFSPTPCQWYQAADVNLLATRREGLARAMIEALACGTPTVSFDVTSAKEILENYQCGLVAPQGNYDALFANIRTIKEPVTAQAMGRNAQALAQKLFDGESNCADFLQILETLIRPKKPSVPRNATSLNPSTDTSGS
jgi:glycosyltransferase involved in cell wall biosynthesis